LLTEDDVRDSHPSPAFPGHTPKPAQRRKY
jgi:hypothetical protein